MSAEREEAARLLVSWWGECHTCRFWDGDPRLAPTRWGSRVADAACTNPRSPCHGARLLADDHCQQWDPRDLDVAMRVLELDLAGVAAGDIIAAIAAEE